MENYSSAGLLPRPALLLWPKGLSVPGVCGKFTLVSDSYHQPSDNNVCVLSDFSAFDFGFGLSH